jgi:hypothetical protein
VLVLTRDSLISCLVAETVAPILLTIRDVLSVVRTVDLFDHSRAQTGYRDSLTLLDPAPLISLGIPFARSFREVVKSDVREPRVVFPKG